MVTGLAVDDDGFEVLAGDERVGSRRAVGPGDAEFLGGLAARYARAVQARSDAGVLVGLGRELYGWLNGDQGQLGGLLERAEPFFPALAVPEDAGSGPVQGDISPGETGYL